MARTARRVVQGATSASPRTIRAKKPTTPWRKFLSTDVPDELRKANPDKHPKWIRLGKGTQGNINDETRVHIAKQEGYTETKLPKDFDAGHNRSVTGGYERKDARLMWLPNERKEARDYYVQERAEAHLPRTEEELGEKARRMGYAVKRPKNREMTAADIAADLPEGGSGDE